MVFAGLSFLIFVFPIVILLHNLLPAKYRNAFLLFASIVFYAWGDIKYIPLLLFISIMNFVLGLQIQKTNNKVYLIIGLVLDVGILLYYKYFAFFMQQLGITLPYEIRLPLGISFFTFQTLSYLIDVYRKDIVADNNIIDYLTYILMFPQLIAGPIVRYSNIAVELKNRQISNTNLEKGMVQFILGLSAKVLLANYFATLFTQANAYHSSFASLVVVLSIGMQYYFDFAGYSLMAIGMGNMMGFSFPINFNMPYSAYSATTFWRRWHITLGTWFKEYVYIPLGGNRVSILRQICNIVVVWSLTGFWHGASWNFLVWGFYFAVVLLFEKFYLHKFLKENSVLSHLYGLIVIFIGWYFVGYTDLQLAIQKIAELFAMKLFSYDLYLLQISIIPIFISVALCIPKVCTILQKLLQCTYCKTIVCIALLLLCIASLVSSGFNPFLYFRF
ncbi:MAG: MBOAT family O-acyltransferase [Eubacteriales bacterium]|nr:MBOAT family O-acyltransferase [Eubacteriales bacterium]